MMLIVIEKRKRGRTVQGEWAMGNPIHMLTRVTVSLVSKTCKVEFGTSPFTDASTDGELARSGGALRCD